MVTDKGLWLSEQEYISLSALEARNSRGLLEEMYSQSAVYGFDPVSWLGLLPDPDPVLRKSGEGLDILRDLTADDKVLSSIQNRKLGTLKKKDYLFEPGKPEDKEPDAASKEICARLIRDLEHVRLYNVFSQVLDAPYYGHTPVEILWEQADGRLHLKDLKPRPFEWFGYDENHDPVFVLDFLDRTVIPEKIVIARHFPDAMNPYGLRLLSRCLWPVAIKKGGIQFWAMLCERFGMPWVVGKVKDKKERNAALGMLTTMVQNAVAVLSGDAEVDVHTFDGNGGNLHQALVRHCDTAIARVLQGQSLTNEGAPGGNYSESKTSKDALGDFQEADEHLVVSLMNDLARVYARVNSDTALAPVFRYREPEDYTTQAELDTKLHGVGVRFKKEHFTRKYRMTDDEFDLAADDDPDAGAEEDSGADDGAHSEFSSGNDDLTPEQADLERFGSDLSASALKDTRKVEKALISEILDSGSYEEAMTRILEKYPALELDAMADLMEKGLLNASLFGVWAEQQEAGDES